MMGFATWSSIPGETPIDPSGLTAKARKTICRRQDLDIAEARNITRATVKYLSARPTIKTAPFHETWSLGVHRDMFGEVWTWAGQVRVHNLNMGCNHLIVWPSLLDLFLTLRTWQDSGMALLEQATRLHYGAVHIHPFYNGNGRWARMLANIWLYLNGSKPLAWPDAIGNESPIRGEYIAALETADRGDPEPLIQLHKRLADL